MNNYIRAQITNMLALTASFKQACKIAALQNDGVVDKEEEKLLKAIEKAADNFTKELNKATR